MSWPKGNELERAIRFQRRETFPTSPSSQDQFQRIELDRVCLGGRVGRHNLTGVENGLDERVQPAFRHAARPFRKRGPTESVKGSTRPEIPSLVLSVHAHDTQATFAGELRVGRRAAVQIGISKIREIGNLSRRRGNLLDQILRGLGIAKAVFPILLKDGFVLSA